MCEQQKGGPPAVCPVCPRACALLEGQAGFCGARVAKKGAVVCQNYGRVTSIALDPIEKKPLYHFYPGSSVLSVGSYGCNLRCPFCQNHAISQWAGDEALPVIAPEALANRALGLVAEGNIGLAFTYNEPAVGYEYVRDAAKAAKTHGLKNVMVTNGYFTGEVLAALLPLVDAFNIDLKCFSEEGYATLGGQLAPVRATIAGAAAAAHLEVTWLVVPGLADDEDQLAAAARWLAGLSADIPLHLSRYFPRWRMGAPATPLATMHRLAQVAGRYLRHVHLGNC